MAISGVIIGELITAHMGLGYLIVFATARADTVVGMAAIAMLCAGGLLLYGLIAAAEVVANLSWSVEINVGSRMSTAELQNRVLTIDDVSRGKVIQTPSSSRTGPCKL